MRHALLALTAGLVLACSNSRTVTGVTTPPDSTPGDTSKLRDPTVDLYNNSPNRAYFSWASGQGVLGADTVPAFTHRCEAFTAVADSAFWSILDTATSSGNWAEQHTAYFDPATRPAWNVAISEYGGGGGGDGIIIIAKDTTAQCTP